MCVCVICPLFTGIDAQTNIHWVHAALFVDWIWVMLWVCVKIGCSQIQYHHFPHPEKQREYITCSGQHAEICVSVESCKAAPNSVHMLYQSCRRGCSRYLQRCTISDILKRVQLWWSSHNVWGAMAAPEWGFSWRDPFFVFLFGFVFVSCGLLPSLAFVASVASVDFWILWLLWIPGFCGFFGCLAFECCRFLASVWLL